MGDSEATSKSEIVLGIDLGTSNSCVAIWDNGRVEIITNNDGNRITPSYVAFTDEDETLVGDAAKSQLSHAPQNTIFGVKRLIGRKFSDPTVQGDRLKWPFKVVQGEDDEPEIVVQYKAEEQRFRPQQISAMVLSKLKEEAEKKLNRGPIKNVVVTVPAYFNDSQRKATKDAASVAGLNVLRVINEPTAAAVAYGLDQKHHSDGKKNIMIYDLGGGTLDVSLVEIQNSIVEVKATSGDTHLGGEDLDNNLVDYVITKFKDKNNFDNISNFPKIQRKLKRVCEETKKNLSTKLSATLEIESLYKGKDFIEKINRSKFEELNENFFEKCIEPVKQCLDDANMDKANVDEVVLVGGSSRIPRVRELLKEFFGGRFELCQSLNPDEAVAQGAAILGAKIIKEDQDDPALKDLDLKDVTPLSLGVEAKGGIMDVIVKRSSSIPVRKNKTHTTIRDNQSTMNFKLYEGERPIAKDNHLLGRFQLTGIPPAPAGVPEIEISFFVDANGMLQVTAKDSRCSNAQGFRVDENSGRLGRDKIEQMIKLAEKFKAEDEKKTNKLLAKNDLEDYARLVIRKVDRSSEEMLGEFIRNQLKSTANEAIAWAEGRGLETEEVEYKTMKENLQAMCRPYQEELELLDI